MIKLIATDVDGTLVKDGTLAIDPEYMTIIEQLIDKGVLFAACSGRQFVSERKLFSPIREKIYYVADGGTVVRSYTELLKVHTIPEDVWKGMYRTMRDHMPSCECFIATPDYALAEDAGGKMFHWLRDSYGYDVRAVESLEKLQRDDIIKMSVYHPTACEEECTPVFIPKWKDKAHLMPAGKQWVDCNPLGVGKWTGVSFLMEKFGIAKDEVCTFGDNLNDTDMLENAGRSYAVANARDEVKQAAKGICAPYWENGVLQVLKEILESL